jgi:hypothetical protein
MNIFFRVGTGCTVPLNSGSSSSVSANMANHTQLSLELLRLFALGELTAVQVHRLASAAWSDGWGRGCPLGKSLAHLVVKTSVLADPLKNCSRNLFLIVERSDLLASAVQPYATRLPDGSDLDVYLPHEIYPSVANNDPSSWCLSSEQVQSDQGFGSLLREWSTHPDVQFGGDLAKVAILGFHADGVQYTSSLRAGSGRSMRW